MNDSYAWQVVSLSILLGLLGCALLFAVFYYLAKRKE